MHEEAATAVEKSDFSGGEHSVDRWRTEIALANENEKTWREDDAPKILSIYANGTRANLKHFNILWSNTEIIKPSLYNNTPRPDVRKRWKEKDPVSAAISEVLERGLFFTLDNYDFDQMMHDVIHDVILPGRGVARVRYKQLTKDQVSRIAVNEDEDGHFMIGDNYIEDQSRVVFDKAAGTHFLEYTQEDAFIGEKTWVEHVPWDMFRMAPHKAWSDCRWIAFKHMMTHADAKDNFGKAKADDLSYDITSTDSDLLKETEASPFKRTCVWEIWDKDSRKVIYIEDVGADKILKIDDDPLTLNEFFPIPRPVVSIKTDDGVPVPEYHMYEKQAEELNEITHRIERLTKALKLRGVYDATQDVLADILEADDNTMLPSVNFAMLMEKGGLVNALSFMPLEEIAKVLNQLYMNRDQAKQTIFEIVGIADIMRGSSKASETATAQNIKQQFGSLRLGRRQSEIQRFARDLFRIKAEIMAEKYDPEMLTKITGKPISKEMLEIMQADGPRGFKIDIETDSTIMVDEKAEQENVAKLLQAISQYVQGIAPAIQAGLFSKDAAQSMLLMVVRKFRGSREVEEVINAMAAEDGGPEQALAQAQQQIQQMQQQMQQAQEQIQAEMEKLSGELEKAKSALAAAEDRKAMDEQKFELERDATQQDLRQDRELHDMKMAQLRALHDQKMEQNRMQHSAKLLESQQRQETQQ